MAKTTLPAGEDLKSDEEAVEADPSDEQLRRNELEPETWQSEDDGDADDGDADDGDADDGDLPSLHHDVSPCERI